MASPRLADSYTPTLTTRSLTMSPKPLLRFLVSAEDNEGHTRARGVNTNADSSCHLQPRASM